jgi:hypothetical protein
MEQKMEIRDVGSLVVSVAQLAKRSPEVKDDELAKTKKGEDQFASANHITVDPGASNPLKICLLWWVFFFG